MTTTDREDLRRRLYRPGADGEDVAAFLGTAPLSPAEQRSAAPVPPPGGRRRTRAAAGLAAVCALLVLLGVVRAAGTDRDPAGGQETAAAARAGIAPLPTAAVDATTRSVFVRALRHDGDAGLAAWLEAATTRRGGQPAGRLVEAHGSGDAVVSLPVEAPAERGRLTVLLVVAEETVAGWSTARLAVADDRTIHLRSTSERSGSLQPGVPAIGRLDFTAASRPVRLLVDAPDGVEWGIAALIGP